MLFGESGKICWHQHPGYLQIIENCSSLGRVLRITCPLKFRSNLVNQKRWRYVQIHCSPGLVVVWILHIRWRWAQDVEVFASYRLLPECNLNWRCLKWSVCPMALLSMNVFPYWILLHLCQSLYSVILMGLHRETKVKVKIETKK